MAIYTIETITNLHVGDMGTSYNVVDKTVQRDALTMYPTIYASSLKGAVRTAAEAAKCERVQSIFGGDTKNITKGNASFNDAHLLLYPVRGRQHPYYMATCPAMLDDAIRLCSLTGEQELGSLMEKIRGLDANTCYGAGNQDWIEDWPVPFKAANEHVQQLLNKLIPGEQHLVLLSDERMGELMETLPVVARNKLNNGISAALWYEEFVPRRSVFMVEISAKEDDAAALDAVLLGDKTGIKSIQIGANATVGYGVCRFRKLCREDEAQ